MSDEFQLFRYGRNGLVSAKTVAEARRIVREYHDEPRPVGRRLHPRTKVSMWDVSRDESYFMSAARVASIHAGKVVPEYN